MPPSGAHDAAYFPAVPAAIDLPAMEHEILQRWRDGKVFDRSLDRTATGPIWTFYEGPPTANGMPGVHHIEARVFKDVFPRFKTMQGFHVPRQAGWDCHGLPVEVAVEKELGLSGKKDIEAYGIAAFNQRCRESVLLHVDAFEELTDRLGYWIDLSSAYRTMDASYIESVWWSLKEIFRKGLLVRDYRISPYCPRCETAAVGPRDGPAGCLPHGDRPGRDGAVPAADRARRGHAAAGRGGSAGVDHHAVDPGFQHRRGRAPRRKLRGGPPGGRPGCRRGGRAADAPGARRRLACRGPAARVRPGRGDVPAAVQPGGHPRCAPACFPGRS